MTVTAKEHFKRKAVWVMENLHRDFAADGIGPQESAAICGNLGHESLGFTVLQEMKPTVAGSRGGYGWAQWTGPRRRAFEAFCKERDLKPESDAANYMFLVHELRGPEKRAIAMVKKAFGLYDKVVAFEKGYERAGVKHYDSRHEWAELALSAWNAAKAAPPLPDVEPAPDAEPVPDAPRKGLLALFIDLILALLTGRLK